jgi:hypothetical protein
MSLTNDARAAATSVAGNPYLEKLARAGMVGYGIVHLLVAWLALQIAFGKSAGAGDQGGALYQLAGEPFGRYLVIAISVGLAAMTLWQILEAAVGHRADRGTEQKLERAASAGRAVVYAYLAWTAAKVVTEAKSSSAKSQQTATADAMSSTGGRWLIGLAGLVVAAIGIGLIVYGVIKRFEKHLMMSRMDARTRKVSRALGVSGYAAKGAAYGIAGILLVAAAVTYDAKKARGLDGALHALAEQPFGTFLLTVVALGIAAFATFCFVQARYRKF